MDNLPEISKRVNATVMKESYQQILCKITHVEDNKCPIEFKGLIKAVSIDKMLKYKLNDQISCLVIGYSDGGIVLSPIE